MAFSKLDAINACLRGIGISPVASEDDNDLDAALASQTIDKVSHDIQSKGWWFNKEYNWKLYPDETTGYINVPGSALDILTIGENRSNHLSIRDDKLYDMWNHTYDLRDRTVQDGYIELAFITDLPFADCPPIARTAIGYAARQQFAQDLQVDERRWKFQKADAVDAMVELEATDARNKKRNALRDNATIVAYTSKVGGPNSRVYSNQVFPKRATT